MGVLDPVIMAGMEMDPHQYSGPVHDLPYKNPALEAHGETVGRSDVMQASASHVAAVRRAVVRTIADDDPLEHREPVVVYDHHLRRVATCLRRLVRNVQHGLAVAEHQQQKHSQHTEAHDEQRFVLLCPCFDRASIALVLDILVLCGQHRLAFHALRHQGSSSLFGGMDGSASHTLTGNASVFTGHLGAWNRSAHNLPIRSERTLPPNTVKSLG